MRSPASEAESVLELLCDWVSRSCAKSLRCLRIYSFIKICPVLEKLLNNCPLLEHLTLSKLTELRPIPIFNEIKTFEFAGCNFAFTYVDIELAKKVATMFPNLRVLAFLDVSWEPVMTSLLKELCNRYQQNMGQRHNLSLYQSFDDLEKFVTNTKAMFNVRSRKEMPMSVEMQHSKSHLTLTVFRAHENHVNSSPPLSSTSN
ncbi:hypothetical protein WR25_05798 [Diploscapter pachys]|uniref:F-box domain-containing protein n=1 Tax=Diploscapter pachys TaxID=2018661 RepID=A0A2A2LZ47_9BILA|nr:hypothetical protein WR25_05798 [Diploscapter pachys]